MPKDHFATNLRRLCNEVPSVAVACRAIGVNRQQFNKYLGGTHRPSPYNLSRICRFFDVEEFEILLPPEQFKNVMAFREDQQRHAAPASFETLVDKAFPPDVSALQRYEGYYHSHFFSFGWEDRIVRSLICFYTREGRMFMRSVERFTDPLTDLRYTTKCDGLVTLMANRLYVIDYMTITGGVVSLTILSATHRSRISLLAGLTMGTSTERDRVPAVTRVAYKSLGKTIDKRQALAACGSFAPDSDIIDEKIVRLLANDIGPDERVLFGRLI